MSEAPPWVDRGIDQDGLGRTYHRGNPTNDSTWNRSWWRKLLRLPAKSEPMARLWWE